MKPMPSRITKKLRKEAGEWDSVIQAESPRKVQELFDQAEPFEASRPVSLPVSLRMDPFDISMLKRIARRKGIPYTQLMAMWLHERLEHEKTAPGSWHLCLPLEIPRSAGLDSGPNAPPE